MKSIILKPSFLKKCFLRILRKTFSWVENNGNANLQRNGEKYFVDWLLEFWVTNSYGKVVVLDVGANLGEYSHLLLGESRKIGLDTIVHIFEPTSSSFKVLSDKFHSRADAILNRSAVSNECGEVDIHYDMMCSRFASLAKRNMKHYGIDLNQSEIVTSIRLDGYISEKKVSHIHLLKMDIEGYEYSALEGLGSYLDNSFIDFIQFEYGGANLDSGTSLMMLFEILQNSGFQIAKVMKRGLEMRCYEPWMENFQYSNYIAISNNLVENFK